MKKVMGLALLFWFVSGQIWASEEPLILKETPINLDETDSSPSFFSMGFRLGTSVATQLNGRDVRTGFELQQFKFKEGGAGGSVGLFFGFRLFKGLIFELEGGAALYTGIHVKNENRLWYPLLLLASGGGNLRYRFEISLETLTLRPFLGFGAGVAGNSVRIANLRKSDGNSAALYSFYMKPEPYWRAFLGWEFPIGRAVYFDLSFQVNRWWGAGAQVDVSEFANYDSFEIESSALTEMEVNFLLEIKPIFTFDLLFGFGWWLA